MAPSFPLNVLGVVGAIERVREKAGKDAAKLDTLSRELEHYLREAAPDEPFLADYARAVLEGYCNMARFGFFPEVHPRDEEL